MIPASITLCVLSRLLVAARYRVSLGWSLTECAAESLFPCLSEQHFDLCRRSPTSQSTAGRVRAFAGPDLDAITRWEALTCADSEQGRARWAAGSETKSAGQSVSATLHMLSLQHMPMLMGLGAVTHGSPRRAA
eukprot:3941432-Rhodomonas_salina.7